MISKHGSTEISWRLRLSSSPNKVFQMLSTSEGSAGFWAESAVETDDGIEFIFPNGQRWKGHILENAPLRRYAVDYIGGSIATFELDEDGSGGTLLKLTDAGVSEEYWPEVLAGWVSVLMQLKAAVDHGVDLRNHDSRYSWDEGYVEN